MKRFSHGFTIVELLVIIAVIGIVATIGVLSWNGVTTGSRDRARETDLKQWIAAFDLYKSRFVVWPVLPASDLSAEAYCLGEFPTDPTKTDTYTNGRCVQYEGSSEFNSLTGTYIAASGTGFNGIKTEIQRVGNFPKNSGTKVKNKAAGPFIYMWRSTSGSAVTVKAVFVNFFENSTCPSGFTDLTSLIASTPPLETGRYVPLSTLVLGASNAGAYPCGVIKQITYDPNA